MPPTAVLIPGNMCDSRLWDSGGALRAMLARHGILAIDADTSRDDSVTGMARRALTAATGPLLPIGFSMGAIVAVEMAILAPRQIAGLVLAGYNATADLPERSALRPVQQLEAKSGGLERVLVEELKPNYLAVRNRGNSALLNLVRDMGMALGPDVFVSQSEALRLRKDRRPALRKLRCPVLYLCGIEDTLCPPDWHRQWMERTPGSRLAMIAGAGHMVPLEEPGAFAEAIDLWIHDKLEILH